MFLQQSFEHRFRSSESGAFQFVDCHREIEQAAFSGKIEDAERTGNAKASPSSHADPIPFVDQQQVSVKGFRQRDSSGFSFIKAGNPRQASGVMDLQPRGRTGDPVSNRQRRERVGKLGLNSERKCDLFEHAGQNVDVPDQNQIIYRARIGDDQPHGSEPELFEGLSFLFKIFESVFLIDAVRLQETV